MKYGLEIPAAGECGDPRTLAELARGAEAAGWDGFFLEDYIIYWKPGSPTYDPWACLAAVALATERIRIGTVVTPLPRRRPWKLAHEVVTLDHLSRGRAILGIGLGSATDESFTRFGEEPDMRVRARILDEGLEILRQLMGGQPSDFRGDHFSLDGATLVPQSVQSPRVPIWVGGGWPRKRLVERAALCDGIVPYKQTPPEPGQAFGPWRDFTPDEVRELKAQMDRERSTTAPIDIAIGGRQRGRDWEEERELIASLSEAGATWWMEAVPAAPLDTMRTAIAHGPLRIPQSP